MEPTQRFKTMYQIKQPRQIPSSKAAEKAKEGREGLPSLKQKKSPRERAGQSGSRRLSQTKEAHWEKEAAHTEAGKLMSNCLRLLLLLQPRGHTNLSKLSAEGLT